jgi:hypothetical protein
MNITTRTLDTRTDDDDLVIYEFDRPSGQALDFLGTCTHCSGGPVLGLHATFAA